jgi:hypothetical protein
MQIGMKPNPGEVFVSSTGRMQLLPP